jgi:hypothetical protein
MSTFSLANYHYGICFHSHFPLHVYNWMPCGYQKWKLIIDNFELRYKIQRWFLKIKYLVLVYNFLQLCQIYNNQLHDMYLWFFKNPRNDQIPFYKIWLFVGYLMNLISCLNFFWKTRTRGFLNIWSCWTIKNQGHFAKKIITKHWSQPIAQELQTSITCITINI